MTGKDVWLVNEMASLITRCLNNEKENGKKVCMFWNTPMCEGIKVCSSCSMNIEKEGEAE